MRVSMRCNWVTSSFAIFASAGSRDPQRLKAPACGRGALRRAARRARWSGSRLRQPRRSSGALPGQAFDPAGECIEIDHLAREVGLAGLRLRCGLAVRFGLTIAPAARGCGEVSIMRLRASMASSSATNAGTVVLRLASRPGFDDASVIEVVQDRTAILRRTVRERKVGAWTSAAKSPCTSTPVPS